MKPAAPVFIIIITNVFKGGALRGPVLISACLLGIPCRYDGTGKSLPELERLLRNRRLVIPFCPETWGGLTLPRAPAEIQDGDGALVLIGKSRVRSKDGLDYTEQFLNGAEAVLKIALAINPGLIILKDKSPSCGVGLIYDGSFQGRLRQGCGVTAALLRRSGFQIYSETEFLKFGSHVLGRK